MPHTVGYAISAFATSLAALLYKYRQGETLSIKETCILMLASAIWGVAAYSLLLVLLPAYNDKYVELALLSVPLGVGFSVLLETFLTTLGHIIELLPEEAKGLIRFFYRGKK